MMLKLTSTVFFVLCLSAQAPAQDTKGIAPVAAPKSAANGATWAVVVGISDYENLKIPDLNYAHRDAAAFVEFLQSAAGGSVPKDNIQMLTNEQATLGNVSAAMDWLTEQAKEGDQVVIYFSGHGDVEYKKFGKPGFLLCWNSPASSYTGGGAYALMWLQEIITTLAIQNKTRVMVITDACHAGTLAGSAYGGAAIAGSNLVTKIANETKILSCQPEELSLEGRQWGGGRGLFSYHFVNGLYGMADKNGDGVVTLSEMDNYLEENVTAQADPQSQVPVLVGNNKERLATVDPALLAKVKQENFNQTAVFAAVDTRGLEDQVLAKVDSATRTQYYAFKKTLQNRQFFQPPGACAEDLYARLYADARLTQLHGAIKRNYAAALQDEAQTAINDYLSADAVELRKRWGHDDRYARFPQYLGRAAALLGEKHYLYASLKAREHYFAGLNLRLRGERENNKALFQAAIDLQKQTLQLDSNAAFAYNELGLLEWRLEAYQKSVAYFKEATLQAPTWVFPWSNLCGAYTLDQNYPEAKAAGLHAVKLDSTCAMAHYNLGKVYLSLNEFPQAADHFSKTIVYDSVYAEAYYNGGLAYVMQGDLVHAEQLWTKYHALNPGDLDGVVDLGEVSLYLGQKDRALKLYRKALAMNPDYFPANLKIGEYYLGEQKYNEAETAFKRLVKIKPANPVGFYWLAYTHTLQNQEAKAAEGLKTAVAMDPDFKILRTDQRLENLRGKERFVALMSQHFPNWKE